ncbi:hypothetical protein [Lysobacter solisilvae (ex Woo and Kim 2020)]|uniref:Uncharacterized protein n=1 Tax=Agrilutibacter terrestris TaxID=2865112 RepID=A0A7H0FXE5_9GAMM|nr:hypothetical protein [Lysobacter terrestris]QNP40711.1 hypothetical protein H8B22_00115 [Lysobacter terrestris]
MIEIILLWGKSDYAIEHWAEAPELVEYNGVAFSRRAGPRDTVETSHEPVAVYAADELTEEEFQDLFYLLQPKIPALGLKFS